MAASRNLRRGLDVLGDHAVNLSDLVQKHFGDPLVDASTAKRLLGLSDWQFNSRVNLGRLPQPVGGSKRNGKRRWLLSTIQECIEQPDPGKRLAPKLPELDALVSKRRHDRSHFFGGRVDA